jgi:hypothetical protein
MSCQTGTLQYLSRRLSMSWLVNGWIQLSCTVISTMSQDIARRIHSWRQKVLSSCSIILFVFASFTYHQMLYIIKWASRTATGRINDSRMIKVRLRDQSDKRTIEGSHYTVEDREVLMGFQKGYVERVGESLTNVLRLWPLSICQYP